jgi:Flp pilus assembly protein TadD
MRRISITTIGLLLALQLAGCASGIPAQSSSMTDDELLQGKVFAGQEEYRIETPEEILALTPEMIAFLDAKVRGTARGMDSYEKLVDLIDALKESGSLALNYNYMTFTAAETFEQGRGNCMSFTNMFLSMARYVGLNAGFQEVKVPPDWTRRGDSFVLSRHINVRVDLGYQGVIEVDFDNENVRPGSGSARISDRRALAHYYNNKGAESMERDEQGLAFQYLRRALQEGDMEFSPAWGNLGTMYLRLDMQNHAEAAFLRALEAEPTDLVAMSNLQRLYVTQGRDELAAHYEARVERHRLRNPYYRYQLARAAYLEGDFESAVKHLNRAIAKKDDESEFYLLLSESYAQLGDTRKADQYLEKAKKVAAETRLPDGTPRPAADLKAVTG